MSDSYKPRICPRCMMRLDFASDGWEIAGYSKQAEEIGELYNYTEGAFYYIHKHCRVFDELNFEEKLHVNHEYEKPIEVVPSSESELLQSIVEKLDVIIEYLTKKSSESLITEDK